MSKQNAYGSSTSDTSFRKTWDKQEYAAKAQEREAAAKEEGKARYEAAAAGKKYHRRAATPEDLRETEARASRLAVGDMVGKTMLVPAGSTVGKRGRGAGFYCEACDLTFKDNLQFVEHLNSKGHLVATGQSGQVRRVGVREVRERLGWLRRRMREEKEAELVDLGTRLERSRVKEEGDRDERRRKRNERRRKGGGGEVKAEPMDV